mmetsp:Transcript_22063/g.63640  ORF Transcript_22063/g.63640 Transcript_22063/m.63640 type:complete len:485 (+) Transcript_22063:714-2168(+)
MEGREHLVGEVRQARQGRPPRLRGLVQALQQQDEVQRAPQLRLLRGDVDHGLDQRDRAVQHTLQVRLVVVDGQGQAPHVRLEQEEGLRVRGVVGLDGQVHLQGAVLGELRVELVLVVPHGELVVLGALAEDAHELHETQALPRERPLELGHSPVPQVVQRGNAPELCRLHGRHGPRGGNRLLQLDAARPDQLVQALVHEPLDVAGKHVALLIKIRLLEQRRLLVIVRGVRREAPEEVRPGHIVDSLLPRLDRSCHDLGIQVVSQLLMKRRLDRKWLVDEASVKVFLGLVNHDHSTCFSVKLWSASTPHHLQHIGDREVDITLELTIIILGTLDDDQMSGKIHAPCQRRRRNQYLDLRLHKELLDDLSIPLRQPRVVDTDPELERVLQAGIRDTALRVLQLVGLQLRELLRVLLRVRGHVGHDVEGRQPRLPPRRHEDKRRLDPVRLDRVVLDRVEARLVHRRHSRHVVLLGVTLDVRSHGHRAD